MSLGPVKNIVILGCMVVQLCAAGTQGENRKSLLVQTTQGPVRGYKDATHDIFTFYGIPYATAPTGRDRYKAPLAPPAWLTPFEAVDNAIICPQIRIPQLSIAFEGKHMQENCLIANVFVPNINKKNIPVVVYIHGGGFITGHGNLLPPNELVKAENIIVVTFNYRLGVHGFVCLGTEDVPGNAGMKDQVALLRWVKNNIANFGGNPDDVTIAGYSAGSVSVDLLMISPLAKGLFTKVIPESGGNLGPFATQTDPIETAKILANHFDVSNTDDIYSLEEFYKSLTFEEMTSYTSFYERKDTTFLFTPCVERPTTGEIFLGDSPYNILSTGNYTKVPLLYGLSNMEGLIRMEFFGTWKDAMNEKFADFLPAGLQFKNEEEKDKVAKGIKEYYFGDRKVNENSILTYIDYFSDVAFSYSILKAVEFHVKAGHDKVYLYEYSFVDENTPVVPYTNVRGATHGAQSMAVLGGWPFISEEYNEMKTTMRKIWANFIKSGSPIPEGSSLPAWPATGARGAPYMSLGNAIQLRDEPLLGPRVAFWDQIYKKYYRVPTPPPSQRF